MIIYDAEIIHEVGGKAALLIKDVYSLLGKQHRIYTRCQVTSQPNPTLHAQPNSPQADMLP